jgi:hypothetical protein
MYLQQFSKSFETNEKVKEGLKQLEEKKNEAEKISNRTTNSIKQFENPLLSSTGQTGGRHRRTHRRLIKHKAKSKRVRFAI